MDSPLQQQIIQCRDAASALIEQSAPALQVRIQRAGVLLSQLGSLVRQWLDTTAMQYIELGYTQQDWQDDIFTWMREHQFYVDSDVGSDEFFRVSLGAVGWSRQVVLTFRFTSASH